MSTLQTLLCKVALFHAIVFFSCTITLSHAAVQTRQTLDEKLTTFELGNDTTAKVNELIIVSDHFDPSQDIQTEKPSLFALGNDTSAKLNGLVIVANAVDTRLDIQTEKSAFSEEPTFSNIITGEEATTEKMFGSRGGFFHPYFSVQEEWTDNLFNINIDQVENLLTSLSTGVWYSLPRLDEVPVRISTHNAAIGGARVSLSDKKNFDRFQTYLLGSLDYNSYSEDADLNHFKWGFEGLYQQNLPVGISFRLVDRLSRDQDSFDRGSFLPQDFTGDADNTRVASTPSLIRSYYSNLLYLSAAADLSGKFSTQLGIANFYLDYDNEENSWLNRMDTRYSASIAYNYSPKTSFFVEYDYAILTYATAEANNGISSFLFTGINWKGSDKTSLLAKGGYQSKEYDSGSLGKTGALTAEIILNYMITDKTNISGNLYKALEETNSLSNNGVDTLAAGFHYEQRFNYRVLGRVDFSYEINDYQGFTRTDINDSIADRKDISFSVRPAVEYTFRDWLMCDIAYIFKNRTSNLSIYDFTTQSVTLSMNLAF